MVQVHQTNGPIGDPAIATVAYGEQYRDLVRAFRKSVRHASPDAGFHLIEVTPHEIIEGIPEHIPANLAKMTAWRDFVHAMPEGTRVALMDCDLLVMKDLREAFAEPFDVAYTVRPGRVRVNAGVVFLRVNAATRRLVDKWHYLNEVIVSRGERSHLQARLRRYGGANQAALENAIRACDWPCHIIELPCEVWNCCDQTWKRFNGQTAVLHIKGKLRRLALGDESDYENHETLGPLASLWRSYLGGN